MTPSLLACALLAACGPNGDRSMDGGASITTTIGTSAAGDGDGDGDGDEGIFDVGGVGTATAEGGSDEGCTYVDLLFVIDNSASMGKYQEALAGAFPSFVDAMYENLPEGTDLHVAVSTTDFNCGSTGCSCAESTSNCMSSATEQEIWDHYDLPQDGNNGGNGSQGRLYVYQGMPYFETTTDEDPTELKTWFTGAATSAGEVGCSFEMSSAGAAYVAHPANADTNSGFIRDEGAVLMIFVLSDEPDKSPEDLTVYHDLLTSAKAGCGGGDCILTAGLIDGCTEQTDQKLWQFLNAFGEAPIWTDIQNVGQYSQVVGDALAGVVGETCATIPPVG